MESQVDRRGVFPQSARGDHVNESTPSNTTAVKVLGRAMKWTVPLGASTKPKLWRVLRTAVMPKGLMVAPPAPRHNRSSVPARSREIGGESLVFPLSVRTLTYPDKP